MDAGEASLVGIGSRQEIARLDAVPGPGEMETFEGTAEGELRLQVAVPRTVGTACNRIHILQPDPCAHIPAPATGVAELPPDRHRACRQGPDGRAADSPGNREP